MSITFKSDMGVTLLDSMGSEAGIVRAAKVSTLGGESTSDGTDVARFVRWLYKEGHGTPFEAPVLTFMLDVPVFVSRQVVKHRISSINETSGRYRELAGVFYIPGTDRHLVQTGKTADYTFKHGSGEQYAIATDTMEQASTRAWRAYQNLLEQGVAKEVARMVLPVSIYTQLHVTMNLRSWMNFVSLRATPAPSHGQYEIAEVADKLDATLTDKFPNVMAAFHSNGYKAV